MAGQAELAHLALLSPLAQLLAYRPASHYQRIRRDTDHETDYRGLVADATTTSDVSIVNTAESWNAQPHLPEG